MTVYDLLRATAYGIGWIVIAVTVAGLALSLVAFAVGEWRYRRGPRVPPLPRSHPAVRPVRDEEGRR